MSPRTHNPIDKPPPPGQGGEKGNTMAHMRTYIWAYLDGKKLVEVIQAALDNKMMVADLKQKLINENPSHEVTFKVVKK